MILRKMRSKSCQKRANITLSTKWARVATSPSCAPDIVFVAETKSQHFDARLPRDLGKNVELEK